uniref:Uncharacterized protein n=1 Tax=Glossina morsitans morsitans TaxID=37546 RepID=A0A1B0FQZ5_GLOMM
MEMNETPKLRKKFGLTLSSRLNKKRHSERSSQSPSFNCKVDLEVPGSPSDGGIEYTPPRKKLINLDDSFEYSPKLLENSFSPSCLQSQTLVIESAEVGWKWNGSSKGVQLPANNDAPNLGNSSSALNNVGTELSSGLGTNKTRSIYNVRREEERKKLELEIRKAKKKLADQKLKERCDKLREQLKCVNKQKPIQASAFNNSKKPSPSIAKDLEIAVASNSLDDFFNDSVSDDLLIAAVAATQEIENKKEYITQNTFSECSTSSYCKKSTESSNNEYGMPVTPTSSKGETRSSFYAKFLEDDFSDDLILSLDECLLEANQAKTPKTPLHRYKSMPIDSVSSKGDKPRSTNAKSMDKGSDGDSGVVVSSTKLFQRHSSSHVLNSKDPSKTRQQNKM